MENTKNILDQIKSDYTDWDHQHGYNLDPSDIYWLIKKVEEQNKVIEGLLELDVPLDDANLFKFEKQIKSKVIIAGDYPIPPIDFD